MIDETTLNIECNSPTKLHGNVFMISKKILCFRECNSLSLKEIFRGNLSFELFIKCIAILSLVLVRMDLKMLILGSYPNICQK